MKLRSVANWTVAVLAIIVSSAARGWAAHPLGIPIPSTPEDPTLILVGLGSAGLAWQYVRSRVRK
jgi:hypothetical protein